MEGWVDLGYPAMHRPGFELAIFWSRVRGPTITLPSQPSAQYIPPTRLNSTVASRRRVGGEYWSCCSYRLQCTPSQTRCRLRYSLHMQAPKCIASIILREGRVDTVNLWDALLNAIHKKAHPTPRAKHKNTNKVQNSNFIYKFND